MSTGLPRRRHAPRLLRLRRPVNLRRALFVLPSAFTLSSVFCGFYALVLASGACDPERLYRASLAVFFGLFFDMADGRVARLTRTQSAFGVQLDSLADLVTFGVAPALIVYRWGLSDAPGGVLVAFIYVACGALRLARFNLMAAQSPRPSKYFLGVPIPLAAAALVSLVMVHQRAIAAPATRSVSVTLLVLTLSYLMISNVRYRSFKDLRPTRRSLTLAFTLVVIFALISARLQPGYAIVAFVWGFLVLGLCEEVIFFRRRRREERAVEPPTLPPSNEKGPP